MITIQNDILSLSLLFKTEKEEGTGVYVLITLVGAMSVEPNMKLGKRVISLHSRLHIRTDS